MRNRLYFGWGIIIILALALIIPSITAIISCTPVTKASCTKTNMFYLQNDTGGYSNAHAQNLSVNTYAYGLCCNADAISQTVTTTCSSTAPTVIRLSALDNAHVEIPSNSNYAITSCIGVSNRNVTCTYATGSCSSPTSSCIASIASSQTSDNNLTNAHIGACSAYPTKICCGYVNRAPILNSSRITPTTAYRNASLMGYCNATDADLDSVIYSWVWYKNGVVNTSGTVQPLPVVAWDVTDTTGVQAYGVAIDNQGNSYVTGYKVGSDYYTVKYNSSGQLQWTATDTYSNIAYAIAADNQGNVYVTGSISTNDIYTVKYDAAGQHQWNVTDTTGYAAYGIAVDAQGNVYVNGKNGANDYYTIKYNSSGQQQWTATDATGYNGRGVAVDTLGNVYVTGISGTSDYHTIKYNSSGQQQWSVTDTFGTTAIGIAVDANSNVYITGNSGSGYYTVKYNSSGQHQWNVTDTAGWNAQGIAIDTYNNVYITGTTSGNDYYTVKYNSSGIPVWNTTTTNGYDSTGIAVDSNYNIYVTGYTATNDYYTIKYSQATRQGTEINVANITNSSLAVGQNWTFSCQAYDGSATSSWMNSSTLLIQNNLPILNLSRIAPTTAYTNNTLVGYCNATDSDLDTVTYSWIWYRNTAINSSGSFANTSISMWYQETANATECTGSWTTCNQVYDGDWGTSGYSLTGGYMYANYTKPAGAAESGTKWQVKDGTGTVTNLTLTTNCFNQNPIRVRGYSFANGGGLNGWSCWDGSSWVSLRSTASGAYLYEEGMYWNVTTTTVTYFNQSTEINVANISSSSLIVGDNWTLSCQANDSYNISGWRNSTQVTIQALPVPIMNSSRIAPTTAYRNNTLIGYCNATSPTGNNISYSWIWYLNGALNSSGITAATYIPAREINVANISSSLLVRDQNWTLSCRANESNLNSTWMNSSQLTISNMPPVINLSQISPTVAYDPTTLLGYCNATDIVDLDTITYGWIWYRNGVLNSSGNFVNSTTTVTYQEAANATSCDSGYTNCANIYDGDWGTNGYSCTASTYVYFNYSKPAGTINSVKWQVYDSSVVNLTVTADCISQPVLRLRASSYCITVTTSWQCYNGTVWNTLRSTSSLSSYLYEEGIFWNITTTTTPYFPQGFAINVANVSAASTSIYDNWTLSCQGFDGINYTQWVNSTPRFIDPGTPVMNTSRISPATIGYINTSLIGYCNATDPVGDAVRYHYMWYKNGVLNSSGSTALTYTQGVEINVANVSTALLAVGQNWTLSCRADDGITNSTWMNSTPVNIRNTPITIYAVWNMPANSSIIHTHMIFVNLTDIDVGQNFTCNFTGSTLGQSNGTATGNLQTINYTIGSLSSGIHYYNITCNDGFNSTAYTGFNFTVNNFSMNISVFVNQTPIYLGQTARIYGTVLLVNGSVVANQEVMLSINTTPLLLEYAYRFNNSAQMTLEDSNKITANNSGIQLKTTSYTVILDNHFTNIWVDWTGAGGSSGGTYLYCGGPSEAKSNTFYIPLNAKYFKVSGKRVGDVTAVTRKIVNASNGAVLFSDSSDIGKFSDINAIVTSDISSIAGNKVYIAINCSSSFTTGYIDYVNITDSSGNLLTTVSAYETDTTYYAYTGTNQINTSTIRNITQITILDNTTSTTSIKYLISVDNRATWNYYNGTAWVTSTLANIQTYGMNSSVINSLTSTQLRQLYIPGTLDIAMDLKTTRINETPTFYNITLYAYPSTNATGEYQYTTRTSNHPVIGTYAVFANSSVYGIFAANTTTLIVANRLINISAAWHTPAIALETAPLTLFVNVSDGDTGQNITCNLTGDITNSTSVIANGTIQTLNYSLGRLTAGIYYYNITCYDGYNVSLSTGNSITVIRINYNLSQFINTNGTTTLLGLYNGTFTNITHNGSVMILDTAKIQGIWQSDIFDATANSYWYNITLRTEPFGSLPNGGISTPDTNMSRIVGLWHLDESSGIIVDNSGQAHHGTNNGATYGSSGIIDTAMNFDGINDYIRINNTYALNFESNNSFTVAAWFKSSGTATDQRIIYKYAPSNGYALFLQNSGELWAVTWNGTSIIGKVTDRNYTDNTWHHIVMVRDQTNQQIRTYVDGILKNTTTESRRNISNTGDIYIGSSDTPGFFFNGSIDEVSLWNRSLTTTEVTDLYTRGLVRITVSARSCDDAVCSGESFTTMNLSTNTGDLSSFALNRYFQYSLVYTSAISGYSPAIYNTTIYYGQNTPPVMNSSRILPVPAYTNESLRGYCTGNDIDGDTLTYYYQWFLNGVLNASGNTSNYTQGIEVSVATISNSLLAVGQNWTLSCRVYDGVVNSSWMNSSIITVQPLIPSIPVLISPTNGNSTIHERQPLLLWNTSTATTWYDINVTSNNCQGFFRNVTAPQTNYTPLDELCLKIDNGYNTYYNWTVRACNSEACSNWSTVWNFTIEPFVDITLTQALVQFGALNLGQVGDTTTGSPGPFIIQNDGNVVADLVNISVNASMWQSVSLGTKYLQAKANISEPGSFNISGSIMNYYNLSTNNVSIIRQLGYNDSADSAAIDIRIEVPPGEPPGTKTTHIFFTWIQTP